MGKLYKLEPVLLEEGLLIARCLHLGFQGDAFARASFPNVSLDARIKDLTERWPANYFSLEAVFMKTVDETSGEIIAYSKWEMDTDLARSLKEELLGKVPVPVPGEGTNLQRRDLLD